VRTSRRLRGEQTDVARSQPHAWLACAVAASSRPFARTRRAQNRRTTGVWPRTADARLGPRAACRSGSPARPQSPAPRGVVVVDHPSIVRCRGCVRDLAGHSVAFDSDCRVRIRESSTRGDYAT
jgi:hypothetical protein